MVNKLHCYIHHACRYWSLNIISFKFTSRKKYLCTSLIKHVTLSVSWELWNSDEQNQRRSQKTEVFCDHSVEDSTWERYIFFLKLIYRFKKLPIKILARFFPGYSILKFIWKNLGTIIAKTSLSHKNAVRKVNFLNITMYFVGVVVQILWCYRVRNTQVHRRGCSNQL